MSRSREGPEAKLSTSTLQIMGCKPLLGHKITHPLVRAAADRNALSNDEDGVAWAISEILSKAREGCQEKVNILGQERRF